MCLNLQPMPFVSNVSTAAAAYHGQFGFSYKFMPLMFLRLYLVLRCVHDFSALYRNRYRILHEIRDSDPNWTLDFTTVMKTYFNANAFMVRTRRAVDDCSLFLCVVLYRPDAGLHFIQSSLSLYRTIFVCAAYFE